MQRADISAEPRGVPSIGAMVELLKPITWFPPMWAFMCGAVSSGVSLAEQPWLLPAGVLLVGPLVCGGSQIVNDWFDRHVDAINEPDRPIPSGRVPGRWGFYYAVTWSLLAVAWSLLLGPWVLAATLLGLFLAWGYSAPPLRFKQNGWYGNLAVGLSYEGLAWVCGAAVLLGGALYRFNAFLIAFDPGPGWHYFPGFGELMITVGIVAFEVMAYLFFVKKTPVLMAGHPPEDPVCEQACRKQPPTGLAAGAASV
jgi:chlorophyll synthase